jgi:hypothetical protein
MKKLLSILVIALFAIAMVSCNKEKNTEKLIIGKWQETEVIGTTTINGVAGEPVSMLEPDETTVITFNKDHTYSSLWTTDGGEVESKGTWSVKDNTLTMTSESISTECNIDDLDKNNMVLSYSESGVESGLPFSSLVVIKMKKI